MKYRNTKTGAVIDVSSKISGENWEKAEEAKTASSATRRKTRRDKNG